MIDPKFFREHFQYLSPSGMYNNLNKTTDLEENKDQVITIKNRLANLMEAFTNNPTSDVKKIKTEITCWIFWSLFLSLIN